MDFSLDDLLSSDAANTAKAGRKFQPKAKTKPKPKPKPNAQPESKPTPTPSTECDEIAATTEEQTASNVNQIIGNVLDSLQSSVEKSQEENAESFLTLDSPNDLLPESATTVNLPPCSETPTADVSMDETGPSEPELISNIDSSKNLESIAELDPLTGEEGAIFNDNEDFQIGDVTSGSKIQDAENSFFLEPLDILAQQTTGSGPRVSKFKPKPKAKSRTLEQVANNPDQNVGPAQHGENIQSVTFQTDFIVNGHGPSFTPDEILGASMGITDSVEYHVNEELSNFTEVSQVDSVDGSGRSDKRVRRVANKALQLIDEAENDGIDDNNNNDDYVPEDESLIERNDSKSKSKEKSKSKSKKPLSDDQKPVRKRKKVREVLNELTEVPKKKFSHSTKRNKRQVNPELLKIPEDEFELHMHNFPLRDLIRLQEHKERIEKKKSSENNTSEDNAQNATFYNYHTHMKIAPRVKWTKQDTELFYEAIQQFGTDLSIITECFPGRTREHIGSKFKK